MYALQFKETDFYLIVGENEDAFLGKYFLKKKGKGLKEKLQGKYRKRENTTQILEGTLRVTKSAFLQ